MLPPNVYSAGEQAIIDAFEARPAKSGSYWTDVEITQLKLNIKAHYKRVQGHTCCYCQQLIPVRHSRSWDTEHIVPRASHALFMFTPRNLAVACTDCNLKKGEQQTFLNAKRTKYPVTGEDFYIVHPHFDNYRDHIERGDFTYTPRTDKGTWTVEKCDLTRFAAMEIGWPEPINDKRFEEEVDQVQAGNIAGVVAIESKLSSAITADSPV